MNCPISKLVRTAAAFAVAAAFAASVRPAGAAVATPDSAPRREVVRYGDLDIATDSGAAALYLRLRHAAEAVCGADTLAPGILELWWQSRTCERDALGHAVAQIDSPKVAAAYTRHFGVAPTAKTARAAAPLAAKQVAVG